jgi:hypothetical protein
MWFLGMDVGTGGTRAVVGRIRREAAVAKKGPPPLSIT